MQINNCTIKLIFIHNKMYKNLMNMPSLSSRLTSIFTSFYFVVSFVLFAYIVAYYKDEIGIKGAKSFTISHAIANCDIPGFSINITFAFLLFIYLIYLRGPHNLFYIKIILLFSVYTLIISIIKLTPDKYHDIHYVIAGIIFTLSTILVIIIIKNLYYYFEKNNIKTYILKVLVVLILINFIVLTILGTTFKTRTWEEDLFAAFENTIAIIVIFIIFMLGFY